MTLLTQHSASRALALIMAALCLLIPSMRVQAAGATDTVTTARTTSPRYPAWLPHATGAVAGAAINIAAVEILKHNANAARPDGTEHSFPSRHAAWASMAATIASHELYRHSPWWVLGFHAATAAVGVQRVAASRHYPGDVAMGYATGLASVEAGYALSRLIFGSRGTPAQRYTNSFTQSIDVATRVMLTFGHDYAPAALSTIVRAIVGDSRWAYHAGIAVESMTARGYDCDHPLTSAGFETGALWRVNPGGGPWAASVIMSAGMFANFGPHRESGFSLKAGAEGECTYRLTPGLSIGATVGGGVRTVSEAIPFVSFGFVTRASF